MMEEISKYNLKLLYVEDEQETRETLTRFLKRRFSRVFVAENGRDAITKFTEVKPDMIVTDLLMPEMSGIDFLHYIIDSGYRNPIIAISALQDINIAVETFNLGVSQYIMKPVDLEELSLLLDRYAMQLLANNQTVFNLTYEDRKLKEEEISHDVSNLFKTLNGKGPRAVKVFIGNDIIEMSCIDFLTSYEKTLMRKGRNGSIVEQMRYVFFQIARIELETLISKQLGIAVLHSNTDVDVSKDVVRFSFIRSC